MFVNIDPPRCRIERFLPFTVKVIAITHSG
jgi:hypothetical protein